METSALSGKTTYSPARQCLRDATHAEHVRLNQHPLLVGITRPDYSLQNYHRVLLAYFHFYRAFEESIDRGLGSLHVEFDYRHRRKIHWIAQDLRYFGIDPDAVTCRPGIPVSPMEFDNVGKLVGALYTIEGSSLGGAVIFRKLATSLQTTVARGARFFYGYGADTPAHWQQFEAFMNAELTSDEIRGHAQGAARHIFTSIADLLDTYRTVHLF